MGPRSGERGNVTQVDHLGTGCGASMGPRSGERGNELRSIFVLYFWRASMGPRSGERGNHEDYGSSAVRGKGFNGAALR